jgi:hypothetical protein
MLRSQYKLAAIRRTEFLGKEIIGIPNIANRNSDFLTLQTLNFKKKIPPESLESKTESEFCLQLGSQKLEPKIGIPNQDANMLSACISTISESRELAKDAAKEKKSQEAKSKEEKKAND